MSQSLFSAEIASLYVKLLPYLDLSNLVFVCYLSIYTSGDFAHAVCETAALLLSGTAITCNGRYLPVFLPCTPGQVRDGRRF